MAQVEASTVIDRPVEAVFAYATNPDTWPRWTTVVQEARITSSGEMGSGTIIHTVAQFMGRTFEVDQVIIEYEPNRLMKGTTTAGSTELQITNTFEPVEDSRARVTWGIEGETGSSFKAAEPVITQLIKRQIETQLGNLKDIMESGTE